jgi:hydroxybutyrate-dimer hydrolase
MKKKLDYFSRPTRLALMLALGAGLAACGGSDAPAPAPVAAPAPAPAADPVTVLEPTANVKPAYLGAVVEVAYDGTADDLLTGGLGKTGLASGVAPSFAAPASPTAAELRRSAIYNNYRALVDTSTNGGYGTLYGPNVDFAGTVTASEGKVAGREFIAYSDDGTGRKNVTLMVQLPATFDPKNPCIITATSSGSRGVYGAISTGEWGLKRGCAVAYTDKGTGGSPYDVQNDTVALIDGTRTAASVAGTQAHFRPTISTSERAAFNTATPNRFAFKHANSQQNPEKDWGKYTLQAAEFALWVINDKLGATNAAGVRLASFQPGNTLVIASSASNGGGSALAAAEQDTTGLISGVAVSEPAVELPAAHGISVRRGAAMVATVGKTLFDFTSMANVYQPCATQAPSIAGSPAAAFVVNGFAVNRCAALKAKGLLTATGTAALAEEALQKLRDYGWENESNVLHPSLAAFEVAPAVAITFGQSLARASVLDNLCGFSFGAAAGGPVTPSTTSTVAQMFATSNGVPPSSSHIYTVNNLSVGGPARDLLSVSASTGLQDFNVDGALCLRDLLSGSTLAARSLQSGIDETRRNGKLNGKPAIIVHGRNDALLPVNHTSRPYFGLNKQAEGAASKLSYIEVDNAQHFDSFIPLLAGYDTRYVPLHVYLFRALDAVYDNLKTGKALPGSQVVRTVPRGGVAGAAPAITAANVPAMASTPAAGNVIAYSAGTVTVPD